MICGLGIMLTKIRSVDFEAMIPYGRQDISQPDIDAVVEVLRSDFLTQGPVVHLFEQAVARYCGAQSGVAVNSATSGLHIACLALGLGPGDWLWTSPNSFVASANVAVYCGAKVDFVDIDPQTYNMSIGRLEEKLNQAESEGRVPKIVVPVHFAGQPCDMQAIHILSKRYNFRVIEDASHAIGASYNGTKVGSCIFSDITVFSFHPVKIITTGEGGMAMTNDIALADKLRRLRTHGITNDAALMQPRPNDEIWNYQQLQLGFNYRMTDIQAALGLSQMQRLDEFVKRRHEIAGRYDTSLSSLPIITAHQAAGVYSSYHLYSIRIKNTDSRPTQRQLYNSLLQSGIGINLHYIPIHRHPFYENLGFKSGDFPEAERFHKEALSIPIYPALSSNDQNLVIRTLAKEYGFE